MNARWLATILTAALLSCPLGIAAQQLEPGQRIRVTAPQVLTERQIGQLLWLDVDSLVFENDGAPAPRRWVVQPQSITLLEASQGRHARAGPGFLIGAGVGLAAGLIAISGEGTCTGSGNYGEICAGIVVGSTLLSGFIGLIIGAIARTERWVPVPVS